MTYAELQVTTHFSFLRGASSAQELFETAVALGIEAIGVVDRNSLAGIVRALEASRATGLRLVVGCRLDLADGMSILVYPTDRAAYSRLTRLITLGKSRGGKNNCILHWDDVIAYSAGMIGILVPDLADETCAVQLRKMAEVFGDRAYVSPEIMSEITLRYPKVHMRLRELNAAQQISAFSFGELDIGLARPTVLGPGINAEIVLTERLLVAMPKDHPLSQQHFI